MSLKNFRAERMAIEGLEEAVENLTHLLPREVKNLTRSAVHGVAGEIRDGMRARAPEDTGTLRKAITAVRRKATPWGVRSDVVITKGKNATHDAWYWHFLEWGTKGYEAGDRRSAGRRGTRAVKRRIPKREARPFVTPTIEEMRPKIPQIFREQVGKKLEALMRRKAKKNGL